MPWEAQNAAAQVKSPAKAVPFSSVWMSAEVGREWWSIVV